MSRIRGRLRRAVVRRARHRCEYCGLAQEGQEAEFHIDHVLPRSAGGPSGLGNLALACVSCSLHKQARQLATDSETEQTVRLFNPRRSRWTDHFHKQGTFVVGLTPIGRATVAALQMNRPRLRRIRALEARLGRQPWPEIES